jgi:hypothetical protein
MRWKAVVVGLVLAVQAAVNGLSWPVCVLAVLVGFCTTFGVSAPSRPKPDHAAIRRMEIECGIPTVGGRMSAETLRQAAALMRERAEAATPGPWRDLPMGNEGSIVLNEGRTISTSRKPATCREFADATHIASWHPAVALAVADWLDATHDEVADLFGRVTDAVLELHRPGALTVARAYLGERP